MRSCVQPVNKTHVTKSRGPVRWAPSIVSTVKKLAFADLVNRSPPRRASRVLRKRALSQLIPAGVCCRISQIRSDTNSIVWPIGNFPQGQLRELGVLGSAPFRNGKSLILCSRGARYAAPVAESDLFVLSQRPALTIPATAKNSQKVPIACLCGVPHPVD